MQSNCKYKNTKKNVGESVRVPIAMKENIHTYVRDINIYKERQKLHLLRIKR